MQVIKYNLIHKENVGTEEAPVYEACKGNAVMMPYSEANMRIAQSEAWNNEIVVEDDGQPEFSAPTKLDQLEAQVTYTAMMTDTMLEV